MKLDIAMLAARPAEKAKTAEDRKADFAFSAVLFSLLGWALLESWNMSIDAAPMSYIISTLFGAPIMASSLLRLRAYAAPAHRLTEMRHLAMVGLRRSLILMVMGAVLGTAAATTSITVVALVVTGFTYFPWSRVDAYKKGLINPLISIVGPAGLAFFMGHPPLTFIVTLPIIWCLWTVATIICLSLCGLELLKKRRRS